MYVAPCPVFNPASATWDRSVNPGCGKMRSVVQTLYPLCAATADIGKTKTIPGPLAAKTDRKEFCQQDPPQRNGNSKHPTQACCNGKASGFSTYHSHDLGCQTLVTFFAFKVSTRLLSWPAHQTIHNSQYFPLSHSPNTTNQKDSRSKVLKTKEILRLISALLAFMFWPDFPTHSLAPQHGLALLRS